jgi:hypothetical protein
MWRQDGSDGIRIGPHHALEDNMPWPSTTQIDVLDSETSKPVKRFITVILPSGRPGKFVSLPGAKPMTAC